MDACIKNIGEEEWRSFKAESVKHGLKMGEFFNKLILTHKNSCTDSNWDKVLHGDKKLKGLLSASEVKKVRKEFREEFSMR